MSFPERDRRPDTTTVYERAYSCLTALDESCPKALAAEPRGREAMIQRGEELADGRAMQPAVTAPSYLRRPGRPRHAPRFPAQGLTETEPR